MKKELQKALDKLYKCPNCRTKKRCGIVYKCFGISTWGCIDCDYISQVRLYDFIEEVTKITGY